MRFGAHVSAAGHIYRAVDRAIELGCDCLQIFSSNPRIWDAGTLDPRDAEVFRKKRGDAGIEPLFLHAPYLVNLASAVPDVYHPSVQALTQALARGDELAADFLVFHVGSAVNSGRDDALRQVASSLKSLLGKDFRTKMLLENTAGAGSSLGATFEELAWILETVGGKEDLGVCLDTCHAFAAGYDLSSEQALEETLEDFDRIIGLPQLRLIHANDSVYHSGSRHDRHHHIGRGLIGDAGFRAIVRHPLLQHLPLVIETPKEDDKDLENLEHLRRLQRD